MEQNFTQQEVLLNTATQFAHREWADKDADRLSRPDCH